MTNPCFAIGIDVGGTKTAAGLVEFPSAKVHSTHTIQTHPERGGEPFLNDVLELARRLQTEALDGKPFTGARGATGTMASSPLPNPWQPHSHAEVHTLEEIASGPALVARYNQAAAKRARTSFDVIEAAAAGNPLAMDVVSIAGRTLGATVALLANTLDPDRIVVGGGLGLSGGLYWTSFIESTRRHLWHEPHRHLPILPAAAGLSAGIIGAAATAWQNRSR